MLTNANFNFSYDPEDELSDVFLASFRFFVKKYSDTSSLALKTSFSQQYLGSVLTGRKKITQESIRRQIAGALGFPERHYEDFLDIGRTILADLEPKTADLKLIPGLELLKDRGYLAVPFSKNLTLAPSGRSLAITFEAESGKLFINPKLHGLSSVNGIIGAGFFGDYMEPVITNDSIILINQKDNNPGKMEEGHIYVLSYNPKTKVAQAKIIKWQEKGKSIIICSPSNDPYKPVFRSLKDITLIGRVVSTINNF
ncbi:MAG: S24 family peptidase [Deltaproteobacteria bacterium]|jgi:hypothetical protein|nr:S24 family peptidase [Deltaproteobacteria bacterium]